VPLLFFSISSKSEISRKREEGEAVRQDGKRLLTTWHVRYKDSAAIAAHGKTEYFKTMGRTMKKEDLLAEPMRILVTKEVGG
jgi:quinol monooxygenase YgiN